MCGDADAYDLALPNWMVWSDHPVRQQFDVVMDLGEGSFAQVAFIHVDDLLSDPSADSMVTLRCHAGSTGQT